ncbi:WD repeat-containing protein 74 [Holothuria leucospilota]|uniref:WD repeat-containing protein 74 n=1 Tax=Holothuria leucospilota TaxID=206669 RepID=A0A9Q1HFX9_HOLLE|nr:WD repeat-containing protein 74 [Holothuria leucospilota]
MAATNNHVWVAAETGILKGLNLTKRTTTNFADFKTLDKQLEILAMSWGVNGKDEILLGLKNGTVKQFDVNQGGFSVTKDYGELGGQYVGLATIGESIITCLSNGHLTVWQDDEAKQELELGPNLKKMKHNKQDKNIIAAGGKENDLKVYDLEKPGKPLFQAKNVREIKEVRNNFLDLRVPVWVNDMQFIQGSSKIVTCTAHHQVIFVFCFLLCNRSVIVGNVQGRMCKIDLRNGKVSRAYRGFAGSIRHIECHPTQPLVGSCGLDRFFRLHFIESGKLENKDSSVTEDKEEVRKAIAGLDAAEDGAEEEDDEDSGNELWEGLEDVGEEAERIKRKKGNSSSLRKSKRTK